ncbi:MAG: hypothetical protein WCK90_02280 [archaeon]
MELRENDVVMCTVKKIEGTTVFLDVEGYGEASMVMSEVAAGRIRNLREYVSPNKKIVCKVLKIQNDHAQMSLRRVTGKEKEMIQEKFKKEKTFLGMLKAITKEPESIISKIKEKYDLAEFFDKAREDTKMVAEFFQKTEAELLAKLLTEKKDKEKTAKKIITLRSDSESGIEDLKSILTFEGVEIAYLGSSQFSISATAKEFKNANAKVDQTIAEIQKRAKDKHATFEIKEK